MGKVSLIGTTLNISLLILLISLFLIVSKDYNGAKDYKNRHPDAKAHITCNNFKSQKDAQAFFDVHGNNGLDNDDDGVVCENLK